VADPTCFPGCICSDCTGHALRLPGAGVLHDARRAQHRKSTPTRSELPERSPVLTFSSELTARRAEARKETDW